ncbi:hypothetical protein [Nocardiopsis sp. NRRL B-16309]|uniref:hypothetical protein n=1 Tax=Nocardiopsis sp. NRRL B-16309 TaxID=1519494 RepID=UPI0006ADAAC5|nr:hypothetical protein [Nocardiopsis sp. NRRL B-16309]KOX10124.1 hypothetical protein ADL05_25930 [Nocardiopsis sp. NRRL B-16309]
MDAHSPDGAPQPRDEDAHELARLARMYGDEYRVWRTERFWMATALVDGVTPTLMEETADALEARLRAPGKPIAAKYTLGSS